MMLRQYVLHPATVRLVSTIFCTSMEKTKSSEIKLNALYSLFNSKSKKVKQILCQLFTVWEMISWCIDRWNMPKKIHFSIKYSVYLGWHNLYRYLITAEEFVVTTTSLTSVFSFWTNSRSNDKRPLPHSCFLSFLTVSLLRDLWWCHLQKSHRSVLFPNKPNPICPKRQCVAL